MTQYYKDAEGGIFALTEIQPVPEGLTQLAAQELDVLLNPPIDIEEVRATQLGKINVAFAKAASAVIAGYPEAERLTWPIQQTEAMAWAADNEAPTPYLDGLAAARGIEPADMRQITLAQVQGFQIASQQLVGTRQRLRDEINAAETIDDVLEVSWP